MVVTEWALQANIGAARQYVYRCLLPGHSGYVDVLGGLIPQAGGRGLRSIAFQFRLQVEMR